ncbi:proline-rich protein 2-like [Phyllostomus hastatus]|uniref:proline-rich protein 2-like n=1 Tax=Phyllostomus hastatus TaxID=9423 RepID=UPI001E68433E|nr:proline-rich protein 2-like [Phyllostomus hastatus]
MTQRGTHSNQTSSRGRETGPFPACCPASTSLSLKAPVKAADRTVAGPGVERHSSRPRSPEQESGSDASPPGPRRSAAVHSEQVPTAHLPEGPLLARGEVPELPGPGAGNGPDTRGLLLWAPTPPPRPPAHLCRPQRRCPVDLGPPGGRVAGGRPPLGGLSQQAPRPRVARSLPPEPLLIQGQGQGREGEGWPQRGPDPARPGPMSWVGLGPPCPRQPASFLASLGVLCRLRAQLCLAVSGSGKPQGCGLRAAGRRTAHGGRVSTGTRWLGPGEGKRAENWEPPGDGEAPQRAAAR